MAALPTTVPTTVLLFKCPLCPESLPVKIIWTPQGSDTLNARVDAGEVTFHVRDRHMKYPP